MSERTFLEEVGKPYSTTSLGHARAWEIRNLQKDSATPPLMFVVESEMGEQFLLGREICGRPKFNMIRYLARIFIELFFEQIKDHELCQYLILRGAYPFDLQYAMGAAPPYDLFLLPTGFIKLQRVLNAEGTDWEIQSHPLVGEYRGDTWLIPDTSIASGSTIAWLLRNGFRTRRPRRVYVFTACGSLQGIQRIFAECQKASVELIPVFSQCVFEVSKVGNLPGLPLTDLSILSPGSITTERTYQKALGRYQGKRMCSIGDVGESLEDPIHYTLKTLWEMKLLGMDPAKENWQRWTVNVLDERFQKRVSNFDPSLLHYFKAAWKEARERKTN